MVLFILFPGMGESEKCWEKYINWKSKKGEIIRTSFLQKLKQLGDVYTYTPNIYNIMNYCSCSPECKLMQNLYSEPNEISINDMNIDSECTRIYEEVKSYKGKFIPIGHSAGGWFAVYFTKLYPSRCSKTILIESIYLTQKLAKWQLEFRILFTKIKNPKIPTQELQCLVQKLHTNSYCETKQTSKLINKYKQIFMSYYYYNTINKIDGELVKPTLFFENLAITDNSEEDKKYDNFVRVKYFDELYKKNGTKKINIHYLLNTGHFPWQNPKYSDIMIKQIKCFIR